MPKPKIYEMFYNSAKSDPFYLQKVNQYYSGHRADMFSWDDKTPGSQVLLAQITGDGTYKDDAVTYFDWLKNSAQKTPKGLLWLSPEFYISRNQFGNKHTKVDKCFSVAPIC